MKSTVQPLITVYLPTHNRLELLKRAVSSVQMQSFSNFELIVVDDGSTDKTPEWLKMASEDDSRINVIRHDSPLGACSSRNRAIFSAKGKYITGLDDDDEFLPNRLELFIDCYKPQYAFICHGLLWHYGRVSKAFENTEKLIDLNVLLNYNAAGNQVFTETRKLREIGGFDPNFKACQDYDTWTRLLMSFGSAKRLPGYSYIHHKGHESPRVTSLKNMLQGYTLYFNKYQHLMNQHQKINQSFMLLVSQRKRYRLTQFIRDCRAGMLVKKIRYLLSSNFVGLASLRSMLLRS